MTHKGPEAPHGTQSARAIGHRTNLRNLAGVSVSSLRVLFLLKQLKIGGGKTVIPCGDGEPTSGRGGIHVTRACFPSDLWTVRHAGP